MNEITTVLFLAFADVIIHLKRMAVRGYQQEGLGSPNEGNRLQASDTFYLSLKRQEKTYYKCQIFFLLYTKLIGFF